MVENLTVWPFVLVLIKMSAVLLGTSVLVLCLRRIAPSLKASIWATSLLSLPVVFILGLRAPLFEILPALPTSFTESFRLGGEGEALLSKEGSANKQKQALQLVGGNSDYIPELSGFAEKTFDLSHDPLLGEAFDFRISNLASANEKPLTIADTPKIPLAGMLTLALWGAGVFILLLPLVVARNKVRQYRQERVSHDTEIARVWTNIDCTLPVLPNLCLSNDADVPFACGIKNPTIVLPRASLSWSPRRLRSTLLHELAHTTRQDPLVRTLCSLVRALFWFHPLVWLAHRELILAQEQACDEATISAGMAPADYAEDLLATVDHSAHTPAQALAMAKWSQLGSRIRLILGKRPRTPRPSGGVVLTTLATTLGLAFLCSSIGFAHSVAPESAEDGEGDSVSKTTDLAEKESPEKSSQAVLPETLSATEKRAQEQSKIATLTQQVEALQQQLDNVRQNTQQSTEEKEEAIHARLAGLNAARDHTQHQRSQMESLKTNEDVIIHFEKLDAAPAFGLQTYTRFRMANKNIEAMEVTGIAPEHPEYLKTSEESYNLRERLFAEFLSYRAALNEQIQLIDQQILELNAGNLPPRNLNNVEKLDPQMLQLRELQLRERLLLASGLSREHPDLTANRNIRTKLLGGEEVELPPFPKQGITDASDYLLKTYINQRSELLSLHSAGLGRKHPEVEIRRSSLRQLRTQLAELGLTLDWPDPKPNQYPSSPLPPTDNAPAPFEQNF